MEINKIVDLLSMHKRNLDDISAEYKLNAGTARIRFLAAGRDLKRVFEKNFAELRFEPMLYGDEKEDVENAISYISNVITALQNGDDIKIAPQD